MASTLKHLRSSSADKRPTASGLADGQLAINTASGTPGLFFKDSNSTIVKVGPAHVDATAPNATPAGSAGNSKGEFWVDINLVPSGLKVWNGSAFSNLTPSGSETVPGLLEVATPGEVQTGTDHQRAVTPSGLQSKISDSTSTTSSTTIASSTAVKSAYDLANAALPKTGGTVTGELLISPSGSLVFEGSVDDGFETTLAVTNPTADRTITFPNVTGTVVTTGDSGTVTSTMIADGTIVNADINASAAIAYGKLALASGIVDSDISGSAEIAVSKLADGAARQLLQTDAAGTGVEWASNIDIPGTLDVTSAATFDSSATIAGDLTVDTSTLKVDSTNNRVGIGTTSPNALLELGTASPILRFSDTDTTGYHQIQSSNTNFIINADPSNADANSSISFNVDGTERASIDSSGRLLVGVTSTSADSRAIIQGRSAGSTGNGVLYLARNSSPGTNGNPLGTLNFSDDGHVANAQIEAVRDGATYTSGSDQPAALTFSTTADGTATLSERMRIDSSGRVGIGTTSPTVPLAVAKDGTTGPTGITGTSTTASFANTAGNRGIGINYDSANVTAGIFSLGTNSQLCFYTPTTATYAERMRIDNSGRLLINTTTSIPVASATASNIQLADGAGFQSLSRWINSTGGPALLLGKSRSATVGTYSVVLNGDALGQIVFAGDDGTDLQTQAASIKAEVDGTPGANDMPGRLVFSTTADGASTVTERMRITNDGALKVSDNGTYNNATNTAHEINNSGTSAALQLFGRHATTPYGYFYRSTAADPNNTTQYVFKAEQNTGVNIYTIWSNGTVTARSDARYKKNIETTRDGYLEDLSQLRVVKYNWYNHEDDSPKELGFIAQEVEQIFPGLVMAEPEKDEDGNETDEVCKSIKFSVFTPMLVKALQEAHAKIQQLEARLTAAGI